MKIAITNLPLWTTATPNYAVHLLGAVLTQAGHEALFPELETGLYRAGNQFLRDKWQEPPYWQNETAMADLAAQARPWFEEQVRALVAADVRMLCLSVTIASLQLTSWFTRFARTTAPELIICCGGPATFAEPHRVLTTTGCHVVVCGEGEVALPALAAAIEHGGDWHDVPGLLFDHEGERVDTGQAPRLKSLSELPAPDWRRIDFSRYTAPEPTISTTLSRGCLQRCAYCAESPLFGAFRSRPGERLAAEVTQVVTHHHLSRLHVLLNDSAINGSPESLQAFAAGIAELPGHITFSGMATASDDLTAEALTALKSAGCNKLSFGIETGSQAVLDSMGKRSHTAAGSLETVRRAKAAGLTVETYIIVGFPSEGEQEFYQTLDWIRRAWPSIDGLSVNILQLLPGSRVYNHPERWQVEGLASPAGWQSPTSTPLIRENRCRILTQLFRGKLGTSGVQDDGLADPPAELFEMMRHASAALETSQHTIDTLKRTIWRSAQ